jgi:hypothetical protein
MLKDERNEFSQLSISKLFYTALRANFYNNEPLEMHGMVEFDVHVN